MEDVTKPSVQLLDADNYAAWSLRMEFVLESLGCWLVVKNGVTDASSNADKEKDRKARARDRKSTRLNSSHSGESRMPSSA